MPSGGGPEDAHVRGSGNGSKPVGKGTLDIVTAFETRDINGAWWLGLVAGILELLLGFWASQQRFPARGALLLLWVGFFALFRGISEIGVAFEVRSRQRG